MSKTIHYVPFAADYQRLLPPLRRADPPADRVVIVRQQLPASHDFTGLSKKFKEQLKQDDVQFEERTISDPYDFNNVFQNAYRHLRNELEDGHDVYVNAAAIPELVGIGYVSAARMLASELRATESSSLADQATISTYYSAPNSFPALDLYDKRQTFRRIGDSLSDLDSIAEHVEMDREFANLVITLFEDDTITTLIEALESVDTNRNDLAIDDLHSGLVNLRDGLEQFADGVDTIAQTDFPDPDDNPEVISQLAVSLWSVEGIDIGPSTFETLQEGADRMGSDPATIFSYFSDRLDEVETFFEDENLPDQEEIEEVLDISSRIGTDGLTSGHRRLGNEWIVTLPEDLNPDLSTFQHGIIYVLSVGGDDIDSVTELTRGLLELTLKDDDLAGSGINWTSKQINYEPGPGDDRRLRDDLIDSEVTNLNVEEKLPSLRNRVQYNLENLEAAGYVKLLDLNDRQGRTPRLTTAGRCWAVVHYDPINDVDTS